ncbi:unnamed protein product, partial [Ectocarpus sp. 12 AP-2014]
DQNTVRSLLVIGTGGNNLLAVSRPSAHQPRERESGLSSVGDLRRSRTDKQTRQRGGSRNRTAVAEGSSKLRDRSVGPTSVVSLLLCARRGLSKATTCRRLVAARQILPSRSGQGG